MRRISDILADLAIELPEESREAILEGIQEPEDDEQEPGLPLGWEDTPVIL